MGYCCGEHLQRKVDSMVVDFNCPVEVTKLNPEDGAVACTCDFCPKPAEYLVTMTMNPADWTAPLDLSSIPFIIESPQPIAIEFEPENVRCEPFDPEVTDPADAVITGPYDFPHTTDGHCNEHGADTAPEIMEDIMYDNNHSHLTAKKTEIHTH